jgi:hypothetical protein
MDPAKLRLLCMTSPKRTLKEALEGAAKQKRMRKERLRRQAAKGKRPPSSSGLKPTED